MMYEWKCLTHGTTYCAEPCCIEWCNKKSLPPAIQGMEPDYVPKQVYLIGSLRNKNIPAIQAEFKKHLGEDVNVFADWYAAGPEADDYWQAYEKRNGFSYRQALERPAATNVFEFDRKHLLASQAVVLIAPAGKSAHLELGWCLGQGKPGYILLDSPDRWDVMLKFADGVEYHVEPICSAIKKELKW